VFFCHFCFGWLILPLIWPPGLFLIVNAFSWRSAVLRWLIIACLGRSVAIAAFVGEARCITDAPEVNLFGPVRSNLNQLVWSFVAKLLYLVVISDNFHTSDSLWLFRLGSLIFWWVSSYSFLHFRGLLVIEPVFVYLIETRLGRLDRMQLSWLSWLCWLLIINTQACTSERDNMIIFYCDGRLSKPRALASQLCKL